MSRDDLITEGASGEGLDDDPEKKAEALEKDIETIRGHIDGLVGELDRRRHAAFDWRLQLERHRTPLLIGAATLVVVTGGGIAYAVHRRRERERPAAKASRLRVAFGRMVAKPERVAPAEPTIGGKVLTAVLSTAATLLVKQLFKRTVEQDSHHPALPH